MSNKTKTVYTKNNFETSGPTNFDVEHIAKSPSFTSFKAGIIALQV